MNKAISFLIIPFFLTSIYFSTSAQSDINRGHLIQIGEIDSLYSEVLGEERRIWVQLPERASESALDYPVLYVLDGGVQFQPVSTVHNLLTPGIIPEMIIVGVGNYETRTRDLTPTHLDEARGSSAWVADSGGGEKFTDFIAQELIPYIDNKYPTTSYRTFIGHSFAGLLVVNTLINRPELFSNYIAIDPSLWWDDAALPQQLKENLKSENFKGKSLFLSMAQAAGMELEEALADTTGFTEGLRVNYDLAKNISSANSTLNFDWKYYGNEDHESVPLITTLDGLRFLFAWYKMDWSIINIINDPASSVDQMTNALLSHYDKLSHQFGYPVPPEEELLNQAGYAFLDRSAEKSFAFFDLAIKHYPMSPNAYDSMADYYVAQGDKLSALKFAEKAFILSGSDYHRGRIAKLRE